MNIRRGYLDRRRQMTVPPIISGLDKATNFKFGRYIHNVHANKSPLKILKNRNRGRIQDSQTFWSTPYYLGNG